MLSPLDLQNKKVVTKKKKYDKAEIDDYIDLLLENYKEAFNEVQELQKKVKTLSDGIQYYRSIESTMQKALVLAEKTSKETKDAAILKAEAIEKDANTKASRIVADAEQEYEKIKDKCVTLVQQFNQYKMQLKQVATAQLELVTSESFDVYSPELDALQSSRNSLPPVKNPEEGRPEQEEIFVHSDIQPEKKAAEEKRTASGPKSHYSSGELIIDDSVLEPMPDSYREQPEEEDLTKTTVLPDLKSEQLRPDRSKSSRDSMSVLTADTIDLRESIQQVQQAEANSFQDEADIRGPVQAKPETVQDAFVIEPSDASPTAPLEAELKDIKPREPEILEPISEEVKEAPTLDSLLQSMNIGKNKKKKKKGQEEDPFEFLGSVDDF